LNYLDLFLTGTCVCFVVELGLMLWSLWKEETPTRTFIVFLTILGMSAFSALVGGVLTILLGTRAIFLFCPITGFVLVFLLLWMLAFVFDRFSQELKQSTSFFIRQPKQIDSETLIQALLIVGVFTLFGLVLYFYLWRYIVTGSFGDLQVLLIVAGFVQTVIGYYFGRALTRISQLIDKNPKKVNKWL